nr:MAG TPA: hypothetical protein [Caudoviricetes sp.]
MAEAVCAVLPRVRIGLGLALCIVPLPFTLCHSPSRCAAPLVSFLFLFCLVLSCLLWVGKCSGGTVSGPLPCLCVRCHSIVDLVLCLCDRIVLLGNSGDGLCWVEWRVYCQLFMCCGVCCSVVCVMEWR